VRTQVDSSAFAPSPPAIWLKATLAIEVSSTSMKVAIDITTAISHGLRLPAAERDSSAPE
jgi:hypothetical protein